MSSQEPIYQYVKGQGWVVGPSVPCRDIRLACGTKVRIELRKPNPGEIWDCGSPTTLDSWEKVLRNLVLRHLSVDDPIERETNWCTIIPLEDIR